MTVRGNGRLSAASAWVAAVMMSVAVPASAQTAATPPSPHWVGSWGAAPAFPNGPEVTN